MINLRCFLIDIESISELALRTGFYVKHKENFRMSLTLQTLNKHVSIGKHQENVSKLITLKKFSTFWFRGLNGRLVWNFSHYRSLQNRYKWWRSTVKLNLAKELPFEKLWIWKTPKSKSYKYQQWYFYNKKFKTK